MEPEINENTVCGTHALSFPPPPVLGVRSEVDVNLKG